MRAGAGRCIRASAHCALFSCVACRIAGRFAFVQQLRAQQSGEYSSAAGLQKRVGRGEKSCRLLLSRFIPSPGGPLHAVPFRTDHQPGPRPRPRSALLARRRTGSPRIPAPAPLPIGCALMEACILARIVHSLASCYIAVMSQVKLVTIYINRMAQARTVRSGALR